MKQLDPHEIIWFAMTNLKRLTIFNLYRNIASNVNNEHARTDTNIVVLEQYFNNDQLAEELSMILMKDCYSKLYIDK